MPLQAFKGWNLTHTYATLPEQFYTRVPPTPVAAPELVIVNQALATNLGLTVDDHSPHSCAQQLSGNVLPTGADSIAQAYAGHQFGHFNILGDGRAHLLGEHIAPNGTRHDIQLKGSGQTPYSRRGDGRAALAPMLREYLISEAMHALGIATTRSLAVVATGQNVFRGTALPGAVLTRVADSHLRVGTFEYAAFCNNNHALKALCNYAIARHYPTLIHHETPYLAFLQAVIERQAKLIASWLHVGFIHGVMNTDNTTISGETIDYGPCAFIDTFASDTVFSSIDRNGRYAFGQQSHIGQWNLTRLAQTLLPLLHDDAGMAANLAQTALDTYPTIFNTAWLGGMRSKLGLFGAEPDDMALVQSLLDWMQQAKADYTLTFRDIISQSMPTAAVYQGELFRAWHERWQARLARNTKPLQSSFCLMRAHNAVIIPRNHHVEDALAQAEEGDMTLFGTLLEAVQNPFTETAANAPFRRAALHANPHYQTFCGT